MKNILISLIILILFASPKESKKEPVSEHIFLGEWKADSYINIKKKKRSARDMAYIEKVKKEQTNIVITEERFFFNGYELLNPQFKYIKIKKNKRLESDNFPTSLYYGLFPNRKIMKVFHVYDEKGVMRNEFEIIDKDTLAIFFLSYYLILKRKVPPT